MTDEVKSVKEKKPDVTRQRRQDTFRAGPATIDPTVPWPEELDPEGFSAIAFAAVVDELGETQDEHLFHLDAGKLAGLPFTAPGGQLPKKRLYTVKAVHKDGTLVQLGFEDQIQNNAGGDAADAIGLRRYARKGIVLLIDLDTMETVYCPAWGCYAKAQLAFNNFCCEAHARHTLPNTYKDAQAIVSGLLSQGVTTSRTWGM